MISKSQKEKYEHNGFNRLIELKEYLEKYENIHLLDGNVIEYNGVMFGGSMSWYDGSYHIFQEAVKFNQISNPVEYWKQLMNDSTMIRLNDFYELAKVEYEKIEKLLTNDVVDVMLTHINPVNNQRFQSPMFRNDLTTAFYCFDGIDLIKIYKPKFWIYGHQHYRNEYEIFNTKCLINAFGYPHESYDFKIKTFEI
jgi:hypothetical protein